MENRGRETNRIERKRGRESGNENINCTAAGCCALLIYSDTYLLIFFCRL